MLEVRSMKCVIAAIVLFVTFPGVAISQQDRMALLIGIDDYFDLTDLQSPSRETEALRDALKTRCNFRHIKCLVDRPDGQLDPERSRQLRRVKLEPLIEGFIRSAENQGVETLVIYFNGHGHALADRSDLMLCAVDAVEDNRKLVNTISRKSIENLLAAARIPNKVLILDCCNAAADGKTFGLASPDPRPESRVESQHNFVILASTGADTKAFEGVFTKRLVDGLDITGDFATDSNQDRQVDVNELFGFVQRSMITSARQQVPVMQVVSGTAGIDLAPAIFTAGQLKSLEVFVRASGGDPVAGASVELSFRPADGKAPEVLASGQTKDRGLLKLKYRLRGTESRSGSYVLSAASQTASVSTVLKDLNNQDGPLAVVLDLIERTSIAARRPVSPAMEPAPAATTEAEPTYQAVLKSITTYVAHSNDVNDICAIKTAFPKYGELIRNLSSDEKLRVSGLTICFPNESTWKNRPELRTKIIAALKFYGVLSGQQTGGGRSGEYTGRELTFVEARRTAVEYINGLQMDICGLKELLPGYSQIMSQLDKTEKLEVLPGLPVCFPSEQTWNARPQIRRAILNVFWRENVL